MKPSSVLLLTGVFLIPVFAALQPFPDWDLWWHLRVGQWITTHGQVPSSDPFTVHGVDRPWVAYSWLFELLVFRLHEGFGLLGILGLRAILGVAIVAAFHRIASRTAPGFAWAILASAVAALAISPLLTERPWLFSLLFTTLTLEVILDYREEKYRWTFWALPLVYLVWANLHIQFVHGFLLLGIALLERRPGWSRLAGLTLACVLATLLNPYHIRLHGVVLEYGTQTVPFQVVNELMALNFRGGWDWLVLGLTLLSTFALGRRKKPTCFEVLLLITAAILTFRARRDLWMIVLASLVLVPTLVPVSDIKNLSTGLNRPGRLLAAVLALLLAIPLGWSRGVSEERLRREEARLFPTRAAEVLRRSGAAGPVYNHFNWGGYLIWKVPELRVTIDGRTNLHGEERILRSLATWAGRGDWTRDPELNAAGVVFAEKGAALTKLLRRDERFRILHEDEQAVIYLRHR